MAGAPPDKAVHIVPFTGSLRHSTPPSPAGLASGRCCSTTSVSHARWPVLSSIAIRRRKATFTRLSPTLTRRQIQLGGTRGLAMGAGSSKSWALRWPILRNSRPAVIPALTGRGRPNEPRPEGRGSCRSAYRQPAGYRNALFTGTICASCWRDSPQFSLAPARHRWVQRFPARIRTPINAAATRRADDGSGTEETSSVTTTLALANIVPLPRNMALTSFGSRSVRL